MSARCQVTNATPLHSALAGLQRNSVLLDIILQKHNSGADGEALFGVHFLTLNHGSWDLDHVQQAFRYLLVDSSSRRYLDMPNQAGFTMLHISAFHLNIDNVGVLLDAGASANVTLATPRCAVFPLQVACLQGRLLWRTTPERIEAVTGMAQKREAALRVASELLKWHHAQGEDEFQGITTLHLAAHMGIISAVEDLQKRRNQTSQPQGHWPGIDGLVTPLQLLLDELVEEQTALVDLAESSAPMPEMIWTGGTTRDQPELCAVSEGPQMDSVLRCIPFDTEQVRDAQRTISKLLLSSE